MVYPIAISPDGGHAAVRAERNGRFTIVLDGKEYGESFERAWDPVFAPEGDKVLIRGIQDGTYLRIVSGVGDF
jgi:hypothetical protein